MINRFFDSPKGTFSALDDVTLLHKVPSIFASEHSFARDEKHYKMFKTINVINALREEGYFPVFAKSNGTRSGITNVDTHKHMVRFTHRDFLETSLSVNDERPELVLTNSHDGSSSFHIMAGLFRKVCSNGLMVGSSVSDARVRHIGHKFDEVISSSLNIAKSLGEVMNNVHDMKGIILNEKQRKDLAAEMALSRFDEKNIKTPENLLTLRRYEDNWAPSLYNTFNVIQENMIRGGQVVNDRVMRPINNIDAEISINRNMWDVAYNKMRDLQVV